MSRPQWAVRCVAGEYKGKWMCWTSHPGAWRLASRTITKRFAENAVSDMVRVHGGTWIVVPVPEPEVQ